MRLERTLESESLLLCLLLMLLPLPLGARTDSRFLRDSVPLLPNLAQTSRGMVQVIARCDYLEFAGGEEAHA